MADTALTTSEESRVNVALEALLTENDPKSMSFEEFRGAQYDYGLAWVYFDEGFGGLGLSPGLQKNVDVRLREAGAKPMHPAMFFMHLADRRFTPTEAKSQNNAFCGQCSREKSGGVSCSVSRAQEAILPALLLERSKMVTPGL